MKTSISDGLSSRALYFPPEPYYSAVKDFQIMKAIRQNKYISKLAKDEDIFVRFMPKTDDTSAHTLIADIVDFNNKLTKKSLWFSSRLLASRKTRDISSIEFINKIEKPLKSTQTFLSAFFQELFHPNQKYFNFSETTPFSVESNLPKHLNDALKEAEQTRYEYNNFYLKQMAELNTGKAKIIKMF